VLRGERGAGRWRSGELKSGGSVDRARLDEGGRRFCLLGGCSVSLASDESVCSSAGYVLFYMRKDRAEDHFTAPAAEMET